MKYLIANWKAHNTNQEVQQWIDIFKGQFNKDNKVKNLLESDKATIIICPAYPYLLTCKNAFEGQKNIFIGSQDISQFPSGSKTGEVSAAMIKDIVTYSIIGHSERRNYNGETEASIKEKINQAAINKIKSVLCIKNGEDIIYPDASIVSYEPIGAIGTGMNQSVEEVLAIKKALKLQPNQPFLYGGSVNKDNSHEYLNRNEIDGLLIGSASLDPIHFYSIISQVQ